MNLDRRMLIAALGAGVALPVFAIRALADTEDATGSAETVLAGIADALLLDFPEQTTGLGIDTGARAPLKARLTDRSALGQRLIADHLRSHLARLNALKLDQLGDAARIDVEVTKTAFETALEGFAFPYGDVAVGGYRNSPYVVIQNVGAFLDIPRFLDSSHQIATTEDADGYLARLVSYPAQLDGETERLKAATAQGVIPPDFLLDKALKQLKLARSGKIDEWKLVTSISDRTARMKGDYRARAAKACTDLVAPALDRQIAALEAQRAKATSDAGVWKLPQGDAYYAWALRAGTTTRMAPDEVHAMGLDQLKRLHAEMDVILKAQGFSKGSVGARMVALAKDPRYGFPDNDAGRAQITALLNKRIADIRARLPKAFNTLVKGNVEVKRLPLAEEPGAPGAYGGPGTIDGSVPGRLWINLRTTDLWTKYSLPTLAYHEAIPGHVWQGEYTFKEPLIRQLLQFNAYSEGWALYSEQLAGELGVYDDDPVGRLGYLQSIAFRACRLVVDTGLHAKRWTRQQAIDWFVTNNGSGIEEVSGEVDRYCSWPGQACGYKVGHSEIDRLRDKAKAALGGKFDLRDFDDAVVLGGNVPMTVLGTIVDQYIAAKR